MNLNLMNLKPWTLIAARVLIRFQKDHPGSNVEDRSRGRSNWKCKKHLRDNKGASLVAQ